MSLPKWVEDASKETGASRADFTPRLVEAIGIMWEVLEGILDLDSDGSNGMEVCHGEAEQAMREVEDLAGE